MKCIMVDDELASRSILSQLCEQETELELCGEFESCLEALKYLNDNEVDVIFLDLHMDVFSGFDLLKTMDSGQKVVLTTSDKEFALKSYEYTNIIDYLVKPITQERFGKAIEKVKMRSMVNRFEEANSEDRYNMLDSKTEKAKKSLYINIDRRLINLHFNDILFVEADGDYVDVQTETKKYHVHTTLKKIKERLPESIFVQIHRSFIINFDKIIDIQDNTVLINKKVIPISRSNRSRLMQRLNL